MKGSEHREVNVFFIVAPWEKWHHPRFHWVSVNIFSHLAAKMKWRKKWNDLQHQGNVSAIAEPKQDYSPRLLSPGSSDTNGTTVLTVCCNRKRTLLMEKAKKKKVLKGEQFKMRLNKRTVALFAGDSPPHQDSRVRKTEILCRRSIGTKTRRRFFHFLSK